MEAHAWLVWILIGIGLFLSELVLPGFILLFFGLGAWAAAALCLVADPSASLQIGVFLAASLVSLILLRGFFTQIFSGRAKTGPEPGEPLTQGQIAQVTADIGPGQPGEIQFRGSFWRAVSASVLPKGSQAAIEGAEPGDPLTMRVKPVSP